MLRRLLLLTLLCLPVVAGCSSEPPSKLDIAQAHFDADELEETTAVCNELIAAGENQYEAHILLGQVDMVEGEYEKAVEDFTAAIDLEPQESRAYTFRSRAYYALEDYENGQLDRELSMSLQPDAAETKQRLSETYEFWDDDTAPQEEDTDTPKDDSDQFVDEDDADFLDEFADDQYDAPTAEEDSTTGGLQPRAGLSAESPAGAAPAQQSPILGLGDPTTPQGTSATAGLGATEQGATEPGLAAQDQVDPLQPLTPEAAAGQDTGYEWNDYLQEFSAEGGTLPATGLGSDTRGLGGTAPPAGSLPATGLLPPASGSGSVTIQQPGMPAFTPQGGVTTGIISGPATGSAPYPVTGPLGAAGSTPATGGSGLPPGGAGTGTVPTYGPLGQQSQIPGAGTGNYPLPGTVQPGTGVPRAPASTPPSTGIRSGSTP